MNWTLQQLNETELITCPNCGYYVEDESELVLCEYEEGEVIVGCPNCSDMYGG